MPLLFSCCLRLRDAHCWFRQTDYSEAFESLKPRLEKLNALYRDVQPGDRYSLTYVPGKGTELALNEEPLGIIEGAEFASALYAMWLGEKPMNKSFKQQVLGST